MTREIRGGIIQRLLSDLRRELALLGRMIRDAELRVLAAASARRRERSSILAILLGLLQDIYEEAARFLTVLAERALRMSREYIWAGLSAGARLLMGVPVDTSGATKFAPGSPRRVRGDSLRDVLRAAAPLLFRRGSRVADSRIDPLEYVMPITRRRIEDVRDRTNIEVSRPWSEKLRWIPPVVRTTPGQIELSGDDAAAVMRRTRQQLEGWLGTEMSHETLRIIANAEFDAYGAFHPVFVGYTLHSRFWPTTDPVHAANDGMQFFIDDRPESSLPWSQRLIPPYRKNCVCYTTPIFELPEDVESGARFGPVIGGGGAATADIEARDIAVYAEWFRWQAPDTQRLLMGDRRYLAAASIEGGRLSLEDFLGEDGRLLTPQEILAETPLQRQQRKAIVSYRIRLIGDRLRELWQSGRWNATPQAEDEILGEILGA